MQLFVGRREFVNQHAAGHHQPPMPLKMTVQRHHQRGVASLGQEFEPRHSCRVGQVGNLSYDTAHHVGPFLDFHVAGRREPQFGGGRTRQAKTQHLPGGRRVQSSNHIERQRVPPEALDEQDQLAGVVAAQGGVAAVEFRVGQAHAAQVQGQGMETVFEDVNRQPAVDFGVLPLERHGVIGGDCRGRPRGVSLRRPLGLPHQVVILRPPQQYPLRLLLQQHVKVGERDVDFPRRGARAAGRARRRRMLR